LLSNILPYLKRVECYYSPVNLPEIRTEPGKVATQIVSTAMTSTDAQRAKSSKIRVSESPQNFVIMLISSRHQQIWVA